MRKEQLKQFSTLFKERRRKELYLERLKKENTFIGTLQVKTKAKKIPKITICAERRHPKRVYR
jgi:hypothetical protein